MHPEILSKGQRVLLPIVKRFKKDFGLVGGTAIALHIGHRQSVDFDLFSTKEFKNNDIRKKIAASNQIEKVVRDEKDEYSIVVGGVKFTFLYYPFKIKFTEKFNDTVSLPSLLTLSAMKAYALGRRAKWKDYVDLFFVVRDHYKLQEIINTARKIFGAEFNEKNFRAQLCYFTDVDFSEKVMYVKNHAVKNAEVQSVLTEFAVSYGPNHNS
ncbi:MAG: nucleotidyl transferase AbiEii/AbiGii toxin family protein [Candidatus Magasanikbacteria bacterium]|nr:nucleotidyl transferase AbiEii/AbiGii toxin family protein [Candidatus Magasanikbacteria bacterium]